MSLIKMGTLSDKIYDEFQKGVNTLPSSAKNKIGPI